MLFKCLKDIKKQKKLGLYSLKPHQGSVPDAKLQLQSLRNCFLGYEIQSSSTKRILVEVLLCSYEYAKKKTNMNKMNIS